MFTFQGLQCSSLIKTAHLTCVKTKGEKPQMSTFEAQKIINFVFEDLLILTILYLLWFT